MNLTDILLGMNKLRVMVACEASGRVRDAFRARGHDAWSCDVLIGQGEQYHITGDVLDHLDDGWDLMIAHPPCTYLASSGMHRTINGERDPQLTDDALKFVADLMDANIPKICIENPVGIISTHLLPLRPKFRLQYIQPYDFGEDASKRTGLYLKGLPNLIPTKYVPPRFVNGAMRWANQADSGQNRLGPSEDRWQERSITCKGVAEAMAEQWGLL